MAALKAELVAAQRDAVAVRAEAGAAQAETAQLREREREAASAVARGTAELEEVRRSARAQRCSLGELRERAAHNLIFNNQKKVSGMGAAGVFSQLLSIEASERAT